MLTGQIEKSGSVSSVQITNSNEVVSTQQRAFADFAVRNLKSWRFEPGRTRDPIRITYSVERVAAPLGVGVDVQFELPDRVKIQVSPLRSVKPS